MRSMMRKLITSQKSVSFILFFPLQVYASLDSITQGHSIRYGETMVSANGTFELRFFSPGNSNKHHLGISYKKVSASAVVWVANRETPLLDPSGVLVLTEQGVLVLLNGKNSTVWSSKRTRNAGNLVVQLLESGNLVVKEGNDSDPGNYIWQSFDYLCDKFLPGMKIGKNLTSGLEWFLTSWKAADDPAEGQFSLQVDLQGFPQVVLLNGTSILFRLGSWNGFAFTGSPEAPANYPVVNYYFVRNLNEVYYWYEVLGSLMSRLIVNPSGLLERYARSEQMNGWKLVYKAPVDQCDNYIVCGAHMRCSVTDNSPRCDCLEGFVSKYPKDWSKGCVRKVPLDCKTDVFLSHTVYKLPDTSASWFNESMNLVECREMCRGYCSCTAFANQYQLEVYCSCSCSGLATLLI